jgi:hypothetical protein
MVKLVKQIEKAYYLFHFNSLNTLGYFTIRYTLATRPQHSYLPLFSFDTLHSLVEIAD